MNMKEHILAALAEQLERWEELLGGISSERIAAPAFDLDWSIQDVVAHLWGWQQVSVSRVEAGITGSDPEYPAWLASLPEDWEENPDQTNARIYLNFHSLSWPEIHQKWRQGYLRLIKAGGRIPEMDLLGLDRYAWLKGASLAVVLIASYEHHQEHLDKLAALLARGSSGGGPRASEGKI